MGFFLMTPDFCPQVCPKAGCSHSLQASSCSFSLSSCHLCPWPWPSAIPGLCSHFTAVFLSGLLSHREPCTFPIFPESEQRCPKKRIPSDFYLILSFSVRKIWPHITMIFILPPWELLPPSVSRTVAVAQRLASSAHVASAACWQVTLPPASPPGL